MHVLLMENAAEGGSEAGWSGAGPDGPGAGPDGPGAGGEEVVGPGAWDGAVVGVGDEGAGVGVGVAGAGAAAGGGVFGSLLTKLRCLASIAAQGRGITQVDV